MKAAGLLHPARQAGRELKEDTPYEASLTRKALSRRQRCF